MGNCSQIMGKKGLQWGTVGSILLLVEIKKEAKTATFREKQKPLQIKTIKGPMGKVDYFERKLDDKRRLTIPTELRDGLAQGVVITRGFGRYLHMYPMDVWETMVEPKLDGDILDEKIADLNVQFRTGKTEINLDEKQGRITLEQHHLAYAGIDKDIIVVGVGRYWRIMAKS